MLVVAKGGTKGGCSPTGCLVDLNGGCPADLKVARGDGSGDNVACRSACEAFADPRYCCSEAYSTPDTCAPSVYSQFFKHACPRSYSYAYDDKTSTFTCASANYMIIFCPLPYTRYNYSLLLHHIYIYIYIYIYALKLFIFSIDLCKFLLADFVGPV
ncbi:variant 5, Thaumatin-like protein 1 [Lathyrus oleraceus]|nr:variant 5, Thaumatin-like protein 1 [Pisum sativum]